MPKINNKLYKIVQRNGRVVFAPNRFKWSLPKGGKPGKWHKTRGYKQLCVNGLHLATAHSIPHWLGLYTDNVHLAVYEAEIDDPDPVIGIPVGSGEDCTKVVVSRARLIREVKGDELRALIRNATRYERRHMKKDGYFLSWRLARTIRNRVTKYAKEK